MIIKKFLITFIVMVLVVGCDKQSTMPTTSSEPLVLKGHIVGTMDVPQSEVKLLDNDKLQKLNFSGKLAVSDQSTGIYQWKFNMRDLTVSVIGKDTIFSTSSSDSLGNFSVLRPRDNISDYKLIVEFSRDEFTGTLIETSLAELLGSGKDEVELALPFSFKRDCCLLNESASAKDQGATTASGCTSCLDNNGYYSWGRFTPRWIGFYGSDCWLAIVFRTNCWNHSYCNGYRNCSPLIGHNSCWHWWWQR